MALCNKLVRFTNLFKVSTYIPVRNAGGVKKKFNPDNVRLPKPSNTNFRGFQVKDGEYVFKNDTLVTQVGLEVYPGQNVYIHGDQWELRAMTSGYAIITTEVLTPYPDSPIYDVVSSGKVMKRPFIHVLEEAPDHYFQLKTLL